MKLWQNIEFFCHTVNLFFEPIWLFISSFFYSISTLYLIIKIWNVKILAFYLIVFFYLFFYVAEIKFHNGITRKCCWTICTTNYITTNYKCHVNTKCAAYSTFLQTANLQLWRLCFYIEQRCSSMTFTSSIGQIISLFKDPARLWPSLTLLLNDSTFHFLDTFIPFNAFICSYFWCIKAWGT